MTDFEKAYNEVRNLAEKFKERAQHYLSQSYNETEVRNDFINKFFIALGWDVAHDYQNNPYQQEVKIEKTVPEGKKLKRADYAFYISPNYRDAVLIAEAKKPSRNLYNEDDYFQTIKYGCHSFISIAILFDFEELHILDCRDKSKKKDVLKRQLKKFHYSEFINKEKFKEIFNLFSRQAVAAGSVENFIGNYKRPYKRIDGEMLDELDGIRDKLAHAIKKQNIKLESETLTEAVQRIINRLVLFRFLEDKLIEQEYYVSRFSQSKTAWKDFIAECARLDAKYNGIVFRKHFIDEVNFEPPEPEIFSNICYQLSHLNEEGYDFDLIPIHIIGSIYERFLGKVVHATDKRVKIEKKSEVRKAGGVYYTPKYIVDYIVNNTVGKLIEGKTPGQIAKMRFADIACGSGSFLISVYDFLLNYHTQWYYEHTEKAKKDKCIFSEDKIFLSLEYRKNILLNNIFGVDIDQQAMEVTQLSLYLKLLEENGMYVQQVMFKEKILPDLGKNIVCGNSLIGTDILMQNFLTSEEERKLNPMNFETTFPDIMNNGGFDAIVGNPPYVNNKELPEVQKKYFVSKYKTAVDQFDLYTLFIENGLNLLTEDGYFSYIIPDAIIDRSSATSLRKFIYDTAKIISLLQINKVFEESKVGSIVLVLQKKKNAKDKFNYFKCANPKEFFFNKIQTKVITQSNIQNFRNYSYLFVDDNEWAVIQKIFNDKINLESISFMGRGEELGKSSNLTKNVKGKDNIGLLYGEDIQRYYLKEPERFISKNDIRKQERLYDVKIVVRQVGEEINASLDEKKYVTIQSVYTIIPNDEYYYKYILGILNSKMMDFIYKKLYKSKELFPRILLESLKELPIKQINFQNKTEKGTHDKMVQLVEQMLDAKKQLQTTKTDKDKTYYEHKCTTLDTQIDQLMYKLYGLTDEEIKIVASKND